MQHYNFSNMKLMFLILRKNTKLLKEYINVKDNLVTKRRQHIILLKNKLAELPPNKYNLLKTIATDVNRFDILTPIRSFMKNSDAVELVIPNTKTVIKTYYHSVEAMRISVYNESINFPDPKILHDKVLNHHFVLDNDSTTINDVVIFEDLDHKWFMDVFNAIKDAKDAEADIIKQQQLLEEQRIAQNYKNGILEKYS